MSWPVWAAPLLSSPFVGSLLGVLALRLPDGRPVVWARSECETCRHPLGAPELVPILSYLALRGRCRRCNAPIGRFHLWAELGALGIAALTITLRPHADPLWIWSGCLLGWAALLLGWIDLRVLRLPDAITLPLLLIGLAATWLRDPEAIGDHALAAVAGFLALRAVAFIYRRLRGRDGLGRGDAKLLAAAGAWLGLSVLPWVVFAGAVATLILALAIGRLRANDAVPFGPGLAGAMWGLFLIMPASGATDALGWG